MDLRDKSYLTKKDSKYLTAADMPDGFSATLVISAVDEEMFENDGEETYKLTLAFDGKEKGITLNATNTENCMKVFGPETDAWVKQKILLTTQYYPKFSTSGWIVTALSEDPNDEIPF